MIAKVLGEGFTVQVENALLLALAFGVLSAGGACVAGYVGSNSII